MRVKRFVLVILFVFVVVILSAGKIIAMPSATPLLADLCSYRLAPYSMFEDSLVAYADEINKYENIDYIREIAIILRERSPYTQEQALAEISRMVDDGKLPYYIVSKGQYKYTPGINTVYPVVNTNLRSQPNKDARIITDVGAGYMAREVYVSPELSDYLGEWTSPQGETWVLVNYRPTPDAFDEWTSPQGDVWVLEYYTSYEDPKGLKLGWLNRKHVEFFTDAQVAAVAEILEHPDRYRQPSSKKKQYDSGSSGVNDDEDETISIETLIKDYDSNPYKARKTYEGKNIKIRGKIYRITNEDGTPLVRFGTDSTEVRCFVSGDDALLVDIETGGYTTIQGNVSKVDTGNRMEAYTLTDCKILLAN